jgi:hypothetical protein
MARKLLKATHIQGDYIYFMSGRDYLV